VPLIEQRIAELLASTDVRSGDYRSIATHHAALPIYADIGGCIALKPTGEWLFFHSNQRWDPPEEVEPMNDNEWRVVALLAAREKYPELAEMIPRRPADAKDCLSCHGSGSLFQGAGCASCCGLGWEGFRIRSPGK
jgi:hypothetical protein